MIKNLFDFLVTAIETENAEHISLATASSEYYQASQEAKKCYKKLQESLPTEMQETLLQFDDTRDLMEDAGTDVYYRKGFSDAIRLLLQAILWKSGKG